MRMKAMLGSLNATFRTELPAPASRSAARSQASFAADGGALRHVFAGLVCVVLPAGSCRPLGQAIMKYGQVIVSCLIPEPGSFRGGAFDQLSTCRKHSMSKTQAACHCTWPELFSGCPYVVFGPLQCTQLPETCGITLSHVDFPHTWIFI